MRKLLLLGVLAALVVAPVASGAHDSGIDDARDCAERDDPATVRLEVLNQDPTDPDPDNVDRGSVCVKNPDDGSTLLYVGGEAVAEENPGEETGVACGAVIVNGEVLAGEDSKDFNHGKDHHHCQ